MTGARTGWSAGTTTGGEWLTILGSHWAAPPLYPTAEAAEAAIPANLHQSTAEAMVVRYVRETWHPGVASGRAYRIIDPPTGAAP